MNAGDKRHATSRLRVPQDLYEEIGSSEKTVQLIKIGLLTLQTKNLKNEIAVLVKRTEEQKKKISELPAEIERARQLLEVALKDNKTLGKLLKKKR